MKILTLCSQKSWYYQDLCRAAGSAHQIHAADHQDLHSASQNNGWQVSAATTDLMSFDAVLVRTMPPGSLEQVVFRMDVLGRLADSGIRVVNSPRAIECAVDKYLSSVRLQQAGLRIPRTRVCQTLDEAMAGYDALGGDVVVKPLFGGEGRGICRVSDQDVAFRAFKLLAQLNNVIYLQEFVPHLGYDMRLFALGNDILGMRRRNDSDWRTNVSRGARTEPLHVDDRLREIASQAAQSIGAQIAGIDLLPGVDGEYYLLEVNAVPGWKALSKTLDIDVAALILHHLEFHECNRGIEIQ